VCLHLLRLRTNETEYRLEIDRLKANLQDDQLIIQQLERDYLHMKLERLSNDNTSTDVNFILYNSEKNTNFFLFRIFVNCSN
jgi:hypothetical protein